MRTRYFLTLLVLTNLGFVEVTGAADPVWLLPLVAVTLAAPWLAALGRYRSYRFVWNAAVIGVFLVLVRHALTAGIQYLLQDGLLLAALCQVHLLNNLREDQKPDLLFFNSFLIAVVTSFLSLDLEYMFVFLVYAPVLIVSMQVNVLARFSPTISRRDLGFLVRDGGWKTLCALGVTLLVFLVMPRDFARKGLLGDHLKPPSLLETGFSPDVSLDRSGASTGDGRRIVMTVTAESGDGRPVPSYWRGATLVSFDGEEWHPGYQGLPEGPGCWTPAGRGSWVRRDRLPGWTVEVDIPNVSAHRLFLPLESRRVTLVRPSNLLDPSPDADLSFRFSPGQQGRIRYEVEVSPGRARTPMGQVNEEPYLSIAPGTVPPALKSAADRIAAAIPPGSEQRVLVSRLRSWLAARYAYVQAGQPGSAKNLSEFVAGQAGGHCEYFATALALMLREERIPCRVVTGYLSSEWDDSARVLTVRQGDAHAWVEVLDPRAGWTTVDATPSSSSSEAASSSGFFGRIESVFSRYWSRLTGFSEQNRAAAVSWLLELPAEVLDLFLTHVALFVALVAAFVAWLFVKRRAARRVPAAVRAYRAALRQTGLSLRPSETPRELLARARLVALPPRMLHALEAATKRHELKRYGHREQGRAPDLLASHADPAHRVPTTVRSM